MNKSLVSVVLASALLLSGCGATTGEGALGGAVGGAGVGLTVAALAETELWHGAAIGAAAGIPAGMLIAATTTGYQSSRLAYDMGSQIGENQEHIIRTEMELRELRRMLEDRRPTARLNPERATVLYLGPTLGNPYR